MGTHSNLAEYPTLVKGGIITFESGEHEGIGNKVVLRYDSGSISGKDFNYTAGSQNLSYGLVVALSGDFYGNYTSGQGDVEQISDHWDDNPERSVSLAQKIGKSLSTDEAGYLSKVLADMRAEEQEVMNRMKTGQDVAQIYASIADKYDTKYNFDTGFPIGAYAWIALCNWDHFGVDAVKAYSSYHTAALRQAVTAYNSDASEVDSKLKEAYFLEGCGQHFLTDIFSSGHMRTPRRILHKNILYQAPPNFEFYPADRCAQKMHNEDCANGLWVTNKAGDSWAAYGDKQLWSGKSNQNFLQAVKAAQAGLNEVWLTRQSGVAPSASDFAALQLIPILDKLNTQVNFTALFRERDDKPGTLLSRKELDRRDQFKYDKMPEKPSFSDWQSMLRNIANSGEDTNMYPFTRQFLSPSVILHLREIEDSHMILNQYGTVDSGTYGAEWTIATQVDFEIPEIVCDSKQWIKLSSLGHNVLSLVGRFKPSSTSEWSTHHLGLRMAKDYKSVDVIWSTTVAEDNSFWTPGDIVYGRFSQDASDIGMIKYWSKGPRGASKLELWTLSASLEDAPVKRSLNWPTAPLNFMLAYQIASDDAFLTFVGYGLDSSKSKTIWYFSSWTGGYSTQVLTKYEESLAFPAQVLLSGKLGTDDDGYRLVRVFYGPTYPTDSQMRIDILNPSRDSSGNIVFNSDPITKTLLITWGAYFATDYLIWFLSDANSDNLIDLIALAVRPDYSLAVIVFPGLSDFTFGSPVVSSIGLNPTQGQLFNASFMTPLTTLQARFTYPEKTSSNVALTTPASIIGFFDNYGILGARALAPLKAAGELTYELKGQTPAIAGQPSDALGVTDKNWMGRGELQHAIGILLA